MSYAGNLEEVANRRIKNGWNLDSIEGYEILVAPSDCNLLNRSGWLIVEGKIYSAIVVDCEQEKHRGQLEERGLLCDQNIKDLTHKESFLILR